MRKKIFLLIFVPLLAVMMSKAHGQTFVGLRAGAGASQLLNNLLNYRPKPPFFPTSYQYGVLGGVVFRHVAESHFGFQGEMNFIQRGFKQKQPEGNISNATLREASYSYLQIPAMANVYVFEGKTKILLNAGPYMGIGLFGTETVRTIVNNEVTETKERDIDFGSDDFDKIDYGVELGLALERYMGQGALQLEGRFTWGMGNIYNADKPYYPDHTQNITIGVTLNYLFHLNPKKDKFDYVSTGK